MRRLRFGANRNKFLGALVATIESVIKPVSIIESVSGTRVIEISQPTTANTPNPATFCLSLFPILALVASREITSTNFLLACVPDDESAILQIVSAIERKNGVRCGGRRKKLMAMDG